jgi:hypothetical protein
MGYTDADMSAHVDALKNDPLAIANLALDGVAAGVPEVVADDASRNVRAGLAGPLSNLFPCLA